MAAIWCIGKLAFLRKGAITIAGPGPNSEPVKPAVVPYPDEWTFSYKWHDRIEPRFHKGKWDFTRLEGASISVFHGTPNPHEAEQDWVKNNWK